jgi:hypothetical protein
MVIERFRDGDAAPVYARFREQGRMLPDGLIYLDSWLAADRTVCYQLMETDDPALFHGWTACWADLVDFDIIPLHDG